MKIEKFFTVRINNDLHKKLKYKSFEANKSMNEIITLSLEKFLKEME